MKTLLIVPLFAFLLACNLLEARADSPQARLDAAVKSVQERTAERLAETQHDLAKRHLESTRTLVQIERLRIATLGTNADEARIEESANYIQTIADGLTPEHFRESYLLSERRRSAIMSFVSERDQSIQYYALSLPANFDPEKAYPLVVKLHGRGPSHPLFYAHLHFRPLPETNQQSDDPVSEYIQIFPWARGNGFYRDYADDDVWQCIAEVEQLATVDPDRRYLSGHSMGSFGAWKLAVNKPDFWAAVVFESLLVASRSAVDLESARNISHLPARIWLGLEDHANFHAWLKQAETVLIANGRAPDIVLDEDAGHRVPRDQTMSNIEWLLQFEREQPQEFSFITDEAAYNTVRGITIRYDRLVSSRPTLYCSISDNTVSIVTRGTEGLSVVPGQNGLGLTGAGSIFWNGELVYEGAFSEETIQAGKSVSGR